MSQACIEVLTSSATVLARWTVERQSQTSEIARSERTGAESGSWFDDWTHDTRARIEALGVALEFSSPSLFISEVEWARSAFIARNVPVSGLIDNLVAMQEVMAARLPANGREDAVRLIERATKMLQSPQTSSVCAPTIVPNPAHAELMRHYMLAMLEARRDDAYRLVVDAVKRGTSVRDLYRWVIEPAMNELGVMWLAGEISVADEHYATAGTQLVMSRLHDHFKSEPKNGKSVISAAVGSDMHDLGLRMVSDLFEMSGWTNHYLGAATPAFALVESALQVRPSLIALSAKLVHHVREAADTIRALRDVPDLDSVPIMVGGRPFTTDLDLYLKVGADACATTAWEAVEIGERLTSAPGPSA